MEINYREKIKNRFTLVAGLHLSSNHTCYLRGNHRSHPHHDLRIVIIRT